MLYARLWRLSRLHIYKTCLSCDRWSIKPDPKSKKSFKNSSKTIDFLIEIFDTQDYCKQQFAAVRLISHIRRYKTTFADLEFDGILHTLKDPEMPIMSIQCYYLNVVIIWRNSECCKRQKSRHMYIDVYMYMWRSNMVKGIAVPVNRHIGRLALQAFGRKFRQTRKGTGTIKLWSTC